jgi:transposase-like protein/IS1 family transposase
MDCPASGQLAQGNIQGHGRKRPRWKCTLCGKTFSARAGTIFFRRRTAEERITRIVTLVGHGCPIPATLAAYGIQAQTVREWLAAAGVHCEAVHQEQVVQPRELHQVQADEIRVTTQAGILWLAMAVMVTTRLWLGGVVSPRRDRTLIQRLANLIAACAQWGPLLLVTDGLTTYVDAFRRTFRTRQTGTGGRPRLKIWPDLVIAQVIKQYAGRKVTGTIHRLVHGSVRMFLTLLWSTPGCQVLNTAFIERLNGTFRARLAVFGRRTRVPARRETTVHGGVYLIGTLYNFRTAHTSLRTKEGGRRTPTIAAGITNHIWTVAELLHHQVPPPPWEPPRRRGRRSRALQALIDRWCPTHRLT